METEDFDFLLLLIRITCSGNDDLMHFFVRTTAVVRTKKCTQTSFPEFLCFSE